VVNESHESKAVSANVTKLCRRGECVALRITAVDLHGHEWSTSVVAGLSREKARYSFSGRVGVVRSRLGHC
jgi:hypothetical protein